MRTPLSKELTVSPDYVRPHRLDVLLDMPSASHDTQQKHAWNADDRSLNVFVKVGPATLSSCRVDGLTGIVSVRGVEVRVCEAWFFCGLERGACLV